MSEIERGYKYHANFIYNQPKIKIKRHRNEDHTTSLNIVETAVEKMNDWGFQQTYYHDRDALPGTNIFTEFFNTVKQSRFTIVVVTRGFIHDSWNRYKSQSAFLRLLEENKSSKFIAFYVDLNDCHIPDEFRVMEPMCFGDNWRNDHHVWESLRLTLNRQVSTPIQDTGRDPYPGPSIRNYPACGVQDTNPPNYPRNTIRGNSLETDVPDSLQHQHSASSPDVSQSRPTQAAVLRPQTHGPTSTGRVNMTQPSQNSQYNSLGLSAHDRSNEQRINQGLPSSNGPNSTLNTISESVSTPSQLVPTSAQNNVSPEARSTTISHPFASSIDRQPPDGAPVPSDSTTQLQTNNSQLQLYDSITEVKEVIRNGSGGREDGVPFSSLNEQDVEVDTNQNNPGRHLSETSRSLEQRTRTGHTVPVSPDVTDIYCNNRPYESSLGIHSPEPQSLLDRFTSFNSRRFVAGVFLGSLVNIYRSDQSFK